MEESIKSINEQTQRINWEYLSHVRLCFQLCEAIHWHYSVMLNLISPCQHGHYEDVAILKLSILGQWSDVTKMPPSSQCVWMGYWKAKSFRPAVVCFLTCFFCVLFCLLCFCVELKHDKKRRNEILKMRKALYWRSYRHYSCFSLPLFFVPMSWYNQQKSEGQNQ